ncbi:hypothetical protein MNB_SM-6-1509 [hydrothermal vent metagenome]|uniref:Uncharacterized protein n=1 Tax=hydrothermal vent metagenome TaxID=652676 RepID=A0A1W1C0C8_9ZZZZ
MNKIFLLVAVFTLTTLSAEAKSLNAKKEEALKEKHIKEQMEREKQFAKEQKFYQGKEYNLSAQKVDQKDLDSVPTIEPENDFDMSDVYRDDI